VGKKIAGPTNGRRRNCTGINNDKYYEEHLKVCGDGVSLQ
jgi:hypothetical protein